MFPTFGYKHSCTNLYVNMISFFKCVYPRAELLDHVVTLFNHLRSYQLFFKVAALSTCPLATYEGSGFSPEDPQPNS